MVVQRDRLIQQVKTAARWELMKEWLEERTGDWNPREEYQKYMFLFGRPSEEPGYVVPPASTGSRVFQQERRFRCFFLSIGFLLSFPYVAFYDLHNKSFFAEVPLHV